MELEAGDPVEARAAALEAHRLVPGLAPPAVVASRLLTRNGDIRRAAKVLEQAWRVEPHPELADAYAQVRPGDSMLDRLKRIRKLAAIRANHPEGAMAVARAAVDARDFAAAREALDGLAKAAPSERVCLLMAEIEERETGDQGKVRSWLTRALAAPRDPTWVADGRVFERWLPVSPVSGRVGAFEWTVPKVAGPPREVVLLQAEEAPAVAALPGIAAGADEGDAGPAERLPPAPPPRPAEPPFRLALPAEPLPDPVVEIDAEVIPEPPRPVPPPPVAPMTPVAPVTPPVAPVRTTAAAPVDPAPAVTRPTAAPASGPVPAATPVPAAPSAGAPPSAAAVPGGSASATTAGATESDDAIPPVARAPDDPGPEPEDEGSPPRDRRFRLF